MATLINAARSDMQETWEAVVDYARGPLVILPGLLVLIIIQAYTSIGQWGPNRVLALSLGFTTGIMFTSGFVPAISRRISIYQSLNNIDAAVRYLRFSTIVSNAAIVLITLLVCLIMSIFGVFTPDDRLVYGVACIALSSIWMMTIWLMLARQAGWLGPALAGGLATCLLVDRLTAGFLPVHLAVGTLVGYAVTIGTLTYIALRTLRKKLAKQPGTLILPSVGYMVYEAGPFFTYGILYMLLVLIPHLLGWVGAQRESDPMWALSSLELALVFAMPPAMLGAGVAERALRLFWRFADEKEQKTSSENPTSFGVDLTNFFQKWLKVYLATLTVISLIAYVLFRIAVGSGSLGSWMQLANLDALEFIFPIGLISYFLLAWGVFNCMFNITLAQPAGPVLATACATGALILVGVPLVLFVGFRYVVVAAVIAAGVFVVVSTRMTLQTLKSAEYHYYAAF